MKKNSIFLSLMLLGLIFFTACDSTEGALYQGENDKVSFLTKATNVIIQEGKPLMVPVGRTSTSGALSVPVTLASANAGYTSVFKVTDVVTFAPGEGQAYATITLNNISSIDPTSLSITPDGFDVGVSLAYPFSLSLKEDMISPSKIVKADVSALNSLQFEDAGKGSIDSSEGWEEDVIEGVTYQKAKGVNAYKVIKPFSNYNIAFLIAADGVSVKFPNQVISPNTTYGPITMTLDAKKPPVYDPATHAVTVYVSAYSVAAGSFGSGKEVFYLPK